MLESPDGAVQSTSRSTVAIAIIGGLLALAIRLYFVMHAQVLQPLDVQSSWGDAAEYYRYAWNLSHHGVFSAGTPGALAPRPDSFRDPGYPVFLAIVMSLIENYDHWYAVILLSQAVIGALAVFLAALAIRDAMPTWLLAVAAAAMALWPHLVAIPAYVLSENLTLLCFAIAALALSRASRRGSLTCTVVLGLSMAAASLTNAVVGPMFILLAVAFAWKRSLSRQQILIFSVIVAIPLVTWNVRNAALEGPYSPSFRAEINLVQGSWPTYHVASQLWAKKDPAGTETIAAINFEIAALHTDRILGLRILKERMSKAPGTYLAWYLGKPALLWGWEIGLGAGDIYVYPTRNSPFLTNPVMKSVEAVAFISNGLIGVLAVAGVVIILCRRAPSAAMLLMAVTVAWVTLVYGALQSDARYSIPYRPAEIALACVAVGAIFKHIRRHSIKASENMETALGHDAA